MKKLDAKFETQNHETLNLYINLTMYSSSISVLTFLQWTDQSIFTMKRTHYGQPQACDKIWTFGKLDQIETLLSD